MTPGRILHLTNLLSVNGRSSFRARALVGGFSDAGWDVLVRHYVAEDRASTIKANPALELDATDQQEFESFQPDVVLSEEGLYVPGTSEWKLPPLLAVNFVEAGGVFLVLDADVGKFANNTGLARETAFFGAHVRESRGVRYLRDQKVNFGHDAHLVCRPDKMLISGWLRPAFEGVREIHAVGAIAVDPIGDIAASAEATARALEGDVFVQDPWPTPFATVRQHRLGHAGLVGALVSPDGLTAEAPGNITWLVQLGTLLMTESRRLRRLRGSQEPASRWEGDPRPTAELITASEDETFEIKQTARYDVRRKEKNRALETEVVEAVAELWNRDGGVLLIGIQDEPRVVTGLANDFSLVRPKNADGFLNWLGQLLKTRINSQVAVSVRIWVEEIEDAEVARIDIPRGRVPAWVDGTQFRMRGPNGGLTLKGPDLDRYLRERFP